MSSTPGWPPPPGYPPLTDIHTGTISVEGRTLTLTGDIDTLLIMAWRSEHPTVPVVGTIDAAGVDFLGSAAIAYLVALVKAATPHRLHLRSPSRPARLPLHVTGIDALFDITN